MKLLALSLLASFPFLEASPLAAVKARQDNTSATAPAVSSQAPTVGSGTPVSTIDSPGSTPVSVLTSSAPSTASASPSGTPTTSGGYNITHPTSGCTPDKCDRCNTKRDSLFDLDAASNLIARAPAPTTPDDKTEDGLTKWTKDVFGSSPKVLDLGGGKDFKPTSMFVPWSGDGSATFSVVKGLFGCASVVVISDDGVYLSHHWQTTINDYTLKTLPVFWANAFSAAIQNKGVQEFTPDPNDPYTTKDDVESAYPTGDLWEALSTAVARDTKPFDESKKPQAAVVVWEGDGNEQFGTTFTNSAAKMQKVVRDTVPALSADPKVVQYKNSDEPREDSAAEDKYYGKVIVSYNSDKKKYEVWMAASSVSEAVLASA